jgi:hypothetical protein
MDRELTQYSSLDDAFVKFGIPDGNRKFVRDFVQKVGISAFYETSGYIKAVRSAGGPDLHIASGWSNGFVSEAEIVELIGDVDRWGDNERARLWGVSHPVNRIGHGGGGDGGRTSRDYGTCPNCFTKFSASGGCNCPT